MFHLESLGVRRSSVVDSVRPGPPLSRPSGFSTAPGPKVSVGVLTPSTTVVPPTPSACPRDYEEKLMETLSGSLLNPTE